MVTANQHSLVHTIVGVVLLAVVVTSIGVRGIVLGAETPPMTAAADEAAIEYYEKRIRPILAANCYDCHGEEKPESNFSATSVGSLLRGGDFGPAIVPGDPDASMLIQAIRYDDASIQMPPKGKLSREQIATLTEWVKAGAFGPSDDSASQQRHQPFDLVERAKHWCFQLPIDVALPQVREASWPRTSIDHFILAKLEAAGVSHSSEADPRTLVRRLYFDLIGLPPTPEEVEEFAAARVTYEELVDRLLASPHFGERWARHWLDLVRYGETRGHESDMIIPNAHAYRDYVIRALNGDVSYSQFVLEHVAGDLLDSPRIDSRTGASESILGTGFWFLGEEVHSPVDIRQDETDRVDNKVDVFSKTFLGLTLACARCHDHKFDALSTKDYYALSGFVLGMSYRQAAFDADLRNRAIYEAIKCLEIEHRSALLAAQYELWRPMLEQADRYLSAVDDARNEFSSQSKRAARAAVIATVASEHLVDERRLAAWISASESEPDGPFGAKRMYGGRTSEGTERVSVRGMRTILEPGALAPQEWFVDGLVFGTGPRRRGQVRFGADADHPIDRVEMDDAIAADTNWDVVRTGPDVEGDNNRIDWQQAARTYKTPTFTLQTGVLAYLVRGSAHAYVEVDTHRTNIGPLHGELVKELTGDDELRWVVHDLSKYVGERAHVEFSPVEAGELKKGSSSAFALVRIVELDDATQELPDPKTEAMPTSAEFAELMPSGMRAEVFHTAAAHLRDLPVDATLDRASTYVINWMLRHPELWVTPAEPQLAAPFFDRRAELSSALCRVSRTAPCAFEGSGVDESVLVRGQHTSPGEPAPRRFLEALDGPTPPEFRSASGRLELARRLVAPDNPLTARVMVNRVWSHLFGRGIVRTVDNFGRMGEAPTHRELLDYLAREFMADGWSVKRLIRSIVTSSTYRQSSLRRDEKLDARNDLFHRANIMRLDAEVIRDALLALSGELDQTLYGPSVEVYLTKFMNGRGRPKQSGPLDGDGRRSIYLRVRRNFLNPMFQAFDFPTPFTTMGRRMTSNVPAQALALLNGVLVNHLSVQWAQRLTATTRDDVESRIGRLYAEAFARPPTSGELSAATAFVARQRERYKADSNDPRVWAGLCHVLVNVKEFIYIP